MYYVFGIYNKLQIFEYISVELYRIILFPRRFYTRIRALPAKALPYIDSRTASAVCVTNFSRRSTLIQSFVFRKIRRRPIHKIPLGVCSFILVDWTIVGAAEWRSCRWAEGTEHEAIRTIRQLLALFFVSSACRGLKGKLG